MYPRVLGWRFGVLYRLCCVLFGLQLLRGGGREGWRDGGESVVVWGRGTRTAVGEDAGREGFRMDEWEGRSRAWLVVMNQEELGSAGGAVVGLKMLLLS